MINAKTKRHEGATLKTYFADNNMRVNDFF